jgi:hypothetical protein
MLFFKKWAVTGPGLGFFKIPIDCNILEMKKAGREPEGDMKVFLEKQESFLKKRNHSCSSRKHSWG